MGLISKSVTKFVFRLIGSWPNGAELDIDAIRIQYDADQQPATDAVTLDQWIINTLRI
jgi:hypothetical protein